MLDQPGCAVALRERLYTLGKVIEYLGAGEQTQAPGSGGRAQNGSCLPAAAGPWPPGPSTRPPAMAIVPLVLLIAVYAGLARVGMGAAPCGGHVAFRGRLAAPLKHVPPG
ncbi:hypothetical protein BKA18_006874 [Streptomyces auratus]